MAAPGRLACVWKALVDHWLLVAAILSGLMMALIWQPYLCAASMLVAELLFVPLFLEHESNRGPFYSVNELVVSLEPLGWLTAARWLRHSCRRQVGESSGNRPQAVTKVQEGRHIDGGGQQLQALEKKEPLVGKSAAGLSEAHSAKTDLEPAVSVATRPAGSRVIINRSPTSIEVAMPPNHIVVSVIAGLLTVAYHGQIYIMIILTYDAVLAELTHGLGIFMSLLAVAGFFGFMLGMLLAGVIGIYATVASLMWRRLEIRLAGGCKALDEGSSTSLFTASVQTTTTNEGISTRIQVREGATAWLTFGQFLSSKELAWVAGELDMWLAEAQQRKETGAALP